MMFNELRRKAIDQGVIPNLGGPVDGHLMQNPNELARFILWLEEAGVKKKYLEIGVSYGGLAKYMESIGWEFYGIDPFNPIEVTRDRVCPHKTTHPEAYTYARNNAPYGLVFIDGDHSYGSVKYDYETYGQFAPFIAFHDIAGLRECEGVKKFWGEIKKKHPNRTVEFIADDPLYKAGIGIVWTV